ncbi:MAG: hypothetical protein LQ338_005545 [Usnochroma carphineum]|nr:MAG: hypothetical protein LQ338_005545 [Usnochroma carphineum]
MHHTVTFTNSVTTKGDTAAKVREWSSIIGIVTAIVGNILISFALNIQRYAHIRLSREKGDAQGDAERGHDAEGFKRYGTQQEEDIAEERSKMNLGAVAEDGAPKISHRIGGDRVQGSKRNSFSSESSSQSTVKPLGSENTPRDTRTYLSSPYWWAGIVLMIIGEGGNFLAYGFAPASIVSPLGVVALVSNCIIAPCLLKERFRQRDLWGVLVAIAGAVVVVLSAKNSETRMGPHDIWSAITQWEFELYLAITAFLIIALIWASGKYGQKSIFIDLGLVGLFGGYTALSTKGVASLLSGTLWRTLTFPITYLLLVVLVGSAVMQIRYVNRALQRFDSTQVIPTQFVLFTISVIIGSAVLYRDFKSATAGRVGKFIGGCLLTFLGVYLITSGRSEESRDEKGRFDDEEEAIGLVDEERLEEEGADHREEHNSLRRKSSLSVAFDSSPRSSRRSSKRAFSNQFPLPRTPQRRHSGASSQSRSSTNQPHPHTPLTENPWIESRDDFYTPPTRPTRNLETTISTPLLPSDAQRSNPSTPNHPGRLSPTKVDRPSALSRHSIAHLTPGPLMSPLSSSLSAIVADNLRRGVHDSPSSAAAARRRPRLEATRRNKTQHGPAGSDDVEDDGSSPLRHVRTNEEGGIGGGEDGVGRKQSVSAALGEFLRLKFRREKDGDSGVGAAAGNEQAGGSNGGNENERRGYGI